MKKVLLITVMLLTGNHFMLGASYNINPTASMTYSPDSLTVNIGDSVTIGASTFHPLVQVSEVTWLAKEATPLAGGWGSRTSAFTIIASEEDTIYFVCSVHVGLGMKGKIIVRATSSVQETTNNTNDLQITPNPISSEGIMTINSNLQPDADITIFDSHGNLANLIKYNNIQFTGNNQFLLNTVNLESGIYMVVVTNGSTQISRQIIIIK